MEAKCGSSRDERESAKNHSNNKRFHFKYIFLYICILAKYFPYFVWNLTAFMSNLTQQKKTGANVLCIVNTTCSMGCPVPKNCRASCKRPNPICPRLPCVKRTPRCLCAKGYVLGPDGRCILKKDCETCKKKSRNIC